MNTCSVLILPENQTVEVEAGSSLLEAVQKAGIPLKSTCGGQGTCGKCTVKVLTGQVTDGGGNISDKLKDQGYILACKASVNENCSIDVPAEFRLHEHQVLMDEDGKGLLREKQLDIFAGFKHAPLGQKFFVKLPPPSLVENASDYSRLVTELKKQCCEEKFSISNAVLKKLPEVLRAGNWDVTVTVVYTGDSCEILRVTAGPDAQPDYGMAIDIGTTTVVIALVDLGTGEIVAKEGSYNKQAAFGDDVISRIVYAVEEKNGLDELQKSVIKTINKLLDKLFQKNPVSPDEITMLVVAGNTTMTHLFLGINPKFIRLEPYIPVANVYPGVRAKELGLNVNPDAIVFNLPSVASYVGGDIVSGALVTKIDESDEVILFIDIGTNGEMVLGSREWQMACACSAGPAFEGGGISFGMRAMDGAIERINITPLTFDVQYQTVGNLPPVGICGSGLIDLLAKLRMAGVIDRTGKMHEIATPRMRKGSDGPEFVLAWAAEANCESDVVITESDIKNLIRAKGAIFAGVRVMLGMVDLPVDAIDRILIAGGFGNYLNIPDAIQIGLLPDLPIEKYQFIGNSSLKGAHLALISRDAFIHAEEVARNMTYLELSLGNMFMDEYVSALFLPHTDLSLFPSVTD